MSKRIDNKAARVTPMDAKIGDTVKEMRQARGWNQDELAEKMEVSKSLLSLLETGQRAWNSSTMTSVCEIFQIGYAELVGGITLSAEEAKMLRFYRLANEAERNASTATHQGKPKK